MNLGSSIVKTSQALETATSSSQLKCPRPASTSRLTVMDQDFCQDLSCSQSKVALKTRPPTCAKMDTTAGQVGATITALPAGSMVMVQIPHGTKAQPTASPPHLEPFLAFRPTLASSMFPRCSLGGGTTLGLAGAQNGS